MRERERRINSLRKGTRRRDLRVNSLRKGTRRRDLRERKQAILK